MRFDLPTVVCIFPLTRVQSILIIYGTWGNGGPGCMCVCVCVRRYPSTLAMLFTPKQMVARIEKYLY